MTQPIVKFKKLHPAAIIPTVATDGSAGFDLYLAYAGPWVLHTDIAVAIPKGYVGKIEARSSMAIRHGMTILGGVIDSDYRGEIRVLYRIAGVESVTTRPTFIPGERIAQLLVVPCITASEEVDELDETERGAGGFGSTGA